MKTDIDGSGTQKDPYQITTVGQLQYINQDKFAHYELANNINAGETSEWNDKKGFNPIGGSSPFAGVFDGNNYEISSLSINRPEQNYVGLFAHNQGLIKNVGLTDVSINGNDLVGGIVGFNGRDYGIVESSYVKGGDISGAEDVGGLVGQNHKKIVLSCAKVDVSGEHNIGSLTGYNRGWIYLCYKIGDLSGLVGLSHSDGEISCPFISSHQSEQNINKDFDVIISRNRCKISYVIDAGSLYLDIDGEIYSCTGISHSQVEELVTLFKASVVKLSDDFKASIVSDI